MQRTTHSKKILVVIGPTASGKSEFAVNLAKKYNGEIISADSRQVYKGLDIGTGKVPGKWITKEMGSYYLPLSLPRKQESRNKKNISAGSRIKSGMTTKKIFTYKGIPHYCIDFVSPRRQYTVADFKRDAQKAIEDILSRGKTPIICGGTGQYVDALLFNTAIPKVAPNIGLRKKLEKKSTDVLFFELQKKDPARAASIDRHNKRRIIRALEIIRTTGKPVPETSKHLSMQTFKHGDFILPITITYLNPPREKLYKKIEARLIERIHDGMVKEIISLHKTGVSWKRMEDLGLEYRYVSRFLKTRGSHSSPLVRGEIRRDVAKKLALNFLTSPYYSQLLTKIKYYTKRQQTWFKKYT